MTDHAPVLLAHCDCNRRYTFVNRPYADRFGLSPQQIVGKTIAEIVGAPAWETLRPHVDAALAGHRVEFEVVVDYNRIGRRVMSCTYSPDLDGNGDVVGVIAAILDVTHRDQAEQALRKVEDFNRQILESSRDCIKVLDLEGRLLYINPAGLADLEVAALDAVLNRPWPEFWHGEERDAALRAVAAAAAGGTGRMEGYCPSASGKPKWWDVVVTPIRGADGEPERLLAISRDITAHVRFEAQLRQREQHLRAVIDTTPECVKVVAADGTLLEMNQAGVQMIEADSVQSVLGRCAFDIVAPEFRERYVQFHNRVCGGQGGTFEFEMIGLRGTRRVMEAHAVPLKGAQGETMLLAIARDVTARKMAAAALEETARQKDEFIAVLAHELRNPLAPLRTSLELLRLAPADPEVREKAHLVMDRQVLQLVRLVDDLLDVSRITRGKIELRREQVRLNDIITGAVETSLPAIDAGEHRLRVTLPEEPVLLDADATRLAQAFSNLLNNAAKYTECGGTIDLSAERQGGTVVVRLRDTGMGIPPDMLSQIFDMFTQGDGSGEQPHGGLGIGLTLARQLVELHGGTIQARSEGLGRGSEFTVSLPAIAVKTGSEGGRATTPAVSTAVPVRRILVVDDNRDAADCLALALKLQGHIVETAYDGHEAVEASERFRPDVALLDIGMPRMNGHEAARQIRQRLGAASPLFIALTGWGQDEDRRRSQEAGFHHHLVKPVDAEQIAAILQMTAEGV